MCDCVMFDVFQGKGIFVKKDVSVFFIFWLTKFKGVCFVFQLIVLQRNSPSAKLEIKRGQAPL